MNKYYSTILLMMITMLAIAQQGDQLKGDTLIVVKAYQPTLVKANKIFDTPVIEDTTKVDLDFNYDFIERQLPSEYKVDTISAARIKGEPLVKLYRGYAKLGIGTNTTPLAEVFYNSLRNKKTSLGVHLKHFSSNGISNIDNSEFSDNTIDLYGKKFTKKHTISAGLDYASHKFNYYGDYDGFYGADDSPDVRIGQTYQLIGGRFSVGNTTTDSGDVRFNTGIGFSHLQDKYDTKENYLKITSAFEKRVDARLIGALEVDIDNNSYSTVPVDSAERTFSTTILKIFPYLKAGNEKWSAMVGPAFFTQIGDESEFFFNIIGEIKVNLIEEILIPYAGVKGDLRRNNYHSFTADNKFVSQDLELINSKVGPQLYGGLRGSFSSTVSFNTSISTGKIKDEFFYVKDYFNPVGNDRSFMVTYADLTLTELSAELAYQNREKLKVFLIGQYFSYNVDNAFDEALHKPDYKVTLTGMYDLRDKIIVKMDVFVIGEQKALVLVEPPAASAALFDTGLKTLSGIADINLGFEYRYTKKVSAFLNFNNIAGVRYQRWQDYPTQRFNVLGGLKFSF